MARRKRTSRVLEKAELRASGLKAVDPQLEFDNSVKLSNFTSTIERLRLRIDAYNTALAVIDSSTTEIAELEKSLGDMADKLLIGIAYRYGKDSVQYEMAGGVRKSERVRRSSQKRIRESASQSNNKPQTA
ncbi:hypothetical protein [Leptolyngbya sp. FACHB-261]|uniref:hypothetical protein n=1 Tax=Leptolyngbya sp. FACHB-261 TaxID=2692806 RepID=UPI0016891071|nr:hypothetical protein [Leptolyngbya sp. FACHB-261]MBD2104946.1 hypothetical protein [Leptolyngbya sp. FACHB-261]